MGRSRHPEAMERVRASKRGTYSRMKEDPVKAKAYNERQNRNRKIRAARQQAEVEALKAALAAASSSNQPAGSAVPALPPPPKDLVEGVLGFEVHHRSPTVAWSNGVKTIVPFIPSRRGKNELEDDAADVIALAQRPVATPDSAPDCIRFFTREEAQSATFVVDARAAIAQDKVVVLLGFQPDAAAEFSIEAIESLGLKPALEVEAHDMKLRAKDPANPMVATVLSEFVENARDTQKIQMVLDMHLPHKGLPKGLEVLDDGLCVGWGQGAFRRDAESVRTSVFTELTWALAHHAGTYSFPHQDTQGCITVIEARAGTKFWGIKRMRVEELDELSTVDAAVENLEAVRTDDKADVFLVQVMPGDVIIQPPGTFHTVYTPVASIFTGRFLYTYDTMHLTEVSQRLNIHTDGTVTNQAVELNYSTFCLLACSLYLNKDRTFYRRALIALCMIVMLPKNYNLKPVEKPNCYSDAAAAVKTVLEGLGFTTRKQGREASVAKKLAKSAKVEYDSLSPSGRYNDPGVEVEIGPFFQV